MTERDEVFQLDEEDVTRMMRVLIYRLARVEGFLGVGTPTKEWVMKALISEPKAGEELREALKSIWPSPPPLEVINSWGYAQRLYMSEYAAITEARKIMPEIPALPCPSWLGAWIHERA